MWRLCAYCIIQSGLCYRLLQWCTYKLYMIMYFAKVFEMKIIFTFSFSTFHVQIYIKIVNLREKSSYLFNDKLSWRTAWLEPTFITQIELIQHTIWTIKYKNSTHERKWAKGGERQTKTTLPERQWRYVNIPILFLIFYCVNLA